MKRVSVLTDSELVTEAQKTVAKFRKAFSEAQNIAVEYGFGISDPDDDILNTVFAKMKEQRDVSVKANVESVFQSALESLGKKGDYARMSELLGLFQSEQYGEVKAKLLELGLFQTKQPRKERVPRDPDAPKTLLRVTFPDGKIIAHHKVVDTFIETIEHIGASKVAELNISVSSCPLVSREKPLRGPHALGDGWFVCTHSSTSYKKTLLDRISNDLQVGLVVEEM